MQSKIDPNGNKIDPNGNKKLFKLISRETKEWGGKEDFPVIVETSGFNVGDKHSPTGVFLRTVCRTGNKVTAVSTTLIPGARMQKFVEQDANGDKIIRGYSIEQEGSLDMSRGRV